MSSIAHVLAQALEDALRYLAVDFLPSVAVQVAMTWMKGG